MFRMADDHIDYVGMRRMGNTNFNGVQRHKH